MGVAAIFKGTTGRMGEVMVGGERAAMNKPSKVSTPSFGTIRK